MPGTSVRGVDPRPPQEEPGEPEEQRDGKVEATEDGAEDRDLDGPRLEGHVRDQDADRGERTHALELWVEASRRGRRTGGVGARRAGAGIGVRCCD
ncbi:hypothetical protein V525_03385 [Gordonia alkanivorans CGMCC 6845]|uniref:Uncharacterized protein n=1 Tax=Gordonia alkanivorans CGMCC 6845 TaxID=1423140 RepID=W9DIX0_9ACTN|nr:hypothetical protein V525_03385 [Gordonia alkanivorans CGMCC 6845]